MTWEKFLILLIKDAQYDTLEVAWPASTVHWPKLHSTRLNVYSRSSTSPESESPWKGKLRLWAKTRTPGDTDSDSMPLSISNYLRIIWYIINVTQQDLKTVSSKIFINNLKCRLWAVCYTSWSSRREAVKIRSQAGLSLWLTVCPSLLYSRFLFGCAFVQNASDSCIKITVCIK